MSGAMTTVAVLGLLGSAVIGGVFFAFSSFVMKALANVPSAEGIAAMQSINVVVLNPSFLGAFMGTAVISVVAAAFAIKEWASPTAPFVLAGALLYLAGTFLVTGLGNVPLNNKLAAVSATDPEAVPVWADYLGRWTTLNTLRTVAAVGAALAYLAGLVQDH